MSAHRPSFNDVHSSASQHAAFILPDTTAASFQTPLNWILSDFRRKHITILWTYGVCLPFVDLVSAAEHFHSIFVKFLIKKTPKERRFRENWLTDVCLTKGPKSVSVANVHVCALIDTFDPRYRRFSLRGCVLSAVKALFCTFFIRSG